MDNDPNVLMDQASNLIKKWTLEGVDARDVYITLRAYSLSLEDVIETRLGPKVLAEIQISAWEVARSIHPSVVRGAP